MGIPGFYGHWLSKDVGKAVTDGVPDFVSSISFDLNGVLHDARKKVYGENNTDPLFLQTLAKIDPLQLELEYYNEVTSTITRIVEVMNPLDCLIIAVDGVAPGAKLQQQRGRRERSARESSPIETFDKNAITPGTDFMMKLDNYLVRYITSNRDSLPRKVIYSSHLAPGEAEHKIMDYYRSGEVSDGEAAKEGAAHIIYGLDADLIMLSLLSPINNIYLSRETVEKTVNIDAIKDYLSTRTNKETAIDDFVVIMFLIGNDFIPHAPALEELSESITKLLEIYSNGDYMLTQSDDLGNREINWNNMKLYLTDIASQEDNLLFTIANKTPKYPSKFVTVAKKNGQFYPQIFRSAWYQNALGAKGPTNFTNSLINIISKYTPDNYELMTEPILSQKQIVKISPVTPERINLMCMDYFRSMAWTYLYYRQGTSAINQDWAYPHHHSPFLTDLANVSQNINNISGYKVYNGMTLFTPLHQLVAVLPIKSKKLVPTELQPLFSYNSPIRDIFPDIFNIEMDGKNKPHEGTPIVPLIDRQRIITAVGQISFTISRAKLWLPVKDIILVRSDEEEENLSRSKFHRQRQDKFNIRQQSKKNRQNRRFTNPNINLQPSSTQQYIKPNINTQRSSTQQYTKPNINTQRSSTQQYTKPNINTQRSSPQQYTRIGNIPDIKTYPESNQRTPVQPIIQRTHTQPVIQRNPTQPVIQRNPTQPIIQRNPTQPIIQQINKGPSLVPIGMEIPTGLRVGKGPSLVPIGMEIPTGLRVGKGTSVVQNNTQVILNQITPKSPNLINPIIPKSPNLINPINQITPKSPNLINPINQITPKSPNLVNPIMPNLQEIPINKGTVTRKQLQWNDQPALM